MLALLLSIGVSGRLLLLMAMSTAWGVQEGMSSLVLMLLLVLVMVPVMMLKSMMLLLLVVVALVSVVVVIVIKDVSIVVAAAVAGVNVSVDVRSIAATAQKHGGCMHHASFPGSSSCCCCCCCCCCLHVQVCQSHYKKESIHRHWHLYSFPLSDCHRHR